MICPNDGINAYTDRYLAGRDVSADYAATVRARVERFVSWCGAELRIGELTCDLANEWLAELAAGGMNPRTLWGHRAALLCVWRSAYQAGENDHPPLRLREIKKPALLIRAYTQHELRRILSHAATLARRHRDGNSQADFWQAAIHVGYCLGARRGDLLDLLREQITDQGYVQFVQHKTGFISAGKLSQQAMHFVGRLSGVAVLPWPYKRACFTRTFKRLRSAAGVTRGTFKWVRRSAGSYAESELRGNGARLLGHRSETTFRDHYEDATISQPSPVEPPPL
jgi:integrase